MPIIFVPTTPAGTPIWSAKATTKQKAIVNLMREAAHMPYKSWSEFKHRGYTIEEYSQQER